MTKKKSNVDYIKEIRREWVINPRTRIQENNLRDKKKRRQEEKRIVKDGFI
jgi:hypothetical protein